MQINSISDSHWLYAKVIILFTFISINNMTGHCQAHNPTPPDIQSDAEYYRRKAKERKLIGRILMGTGSVAVGIGSDFNIPKLQTVGLILAACSIPFHISSYLSNERAQQLEVTVLPQSNPDDNFMSLPSIQIVSLKMNF